MTPPLNRPAGPFAPPELHPDRTSPQQGDLLALTPTGLPTTHASHAWVAAHSDPTLFQVYWLSGTHTGTTTRLHADTLRPLHYGLLGSLPSLAYLSAAVVNLVLCGARVADDQSVNQTVNHYHSKLR